MSKRRFFATSLLSMILIMCLGTVVLVSCGSAFLENENFVRSTKDVNVESFIAVAPEDDSEEVLQAEDVIEKAEESIDSFNEFSCTFTKEENIKGKVRGPLKAEVVCRQRPFAVAMDWEPGNEVIRSTYREGDDNMKVKLSGLAGVLGVVEIAPDDERVLEKHLRPITEFGFEGVVEQAAEAVKDGDEAVVSQNDEGETLLTITTGGEKVSFVFDEDFTPSYAEKILDGEVIFIYQWDNVSKDIEISDDDFGF